MSISPIDAAAKAIYQLTEDQPWEAATLDEEDKYRRIAESVLDRAHAAAVEHPAVLESAANAISQSSGMRFDGFWSRMDELEPEDRAYAIQEARSALTAAQGAIRLIETARKAGR